MRPLTASRPKVMLPVAGKPLLEHLLERAIQAGFDDFLIVTHYQGRFVKDHFGNGKRWKVRIRYVDQGQAGGSGHAVARLQGKVHEPFLLLYGDSFFESKDLAKFRNLKTLAIGAKKVPDASSYGLLALRKNRLVSIKEKPKRPRAGWVNIGAYVLTPSIVNVCSRLPTSSRGERELTDAIGVAAKNEGVRVLSCQSWVDVGRPWHLLDLQEQLMQQLRGRIQGKVDRSVVFEGPVVVEKGAHVRHGTVIEGPCIIQAGARVGPFAYVRGSTVIGPRCHVGAHTEIKNSILFEDSNVPHLSYVGDSLLGARVNLGAGTNIANLKHSDRTVRVRFEDGQWVETGRRKFGVILGDDVKTGINVTLNVGSVLGQRVRVYPGRIVDGWIAPGATVE